MGDGVGVIAYHAWPIAHDQAMLQALWWWLVVQVVALCAAPLALTFFRPLADRGYGLAKAFGLLLFGYVTWLLVVSQLLENGPVALLVVLLLIAGGSYLAWRHQAAALRAFWRRRRGLLALEEGILLAAYLGFLLIRSRNADIAGTEKFMDFAFMNAVTRSTFFPPLDPWLAPSLSVPHPTINYYYFGYLIQGLLLELAGVAPAEGFNLALGVLFGLTAVGMFSLGYGLTRDLAAERPPGPPAAGSAAAAGARRPAARRRAARAAAAGPSWSLKAAWPFVAAGLAAVYLHLIAGNLWTALRRFDSSGLWQKGFWDGIGWNATRVLVIKQGEVDVDYTINEFPSFSFLLGDLHPHVLALPFAVMAVGLAYAWLLRPPRLYRWAIAGEPLFSGVRGQGSGLGGQTGSHPKTADDAAQGSSAGEAQEGRGPLPRAAPPAWREGWERLAPFGELAPGAMILGSLYFLNSWDFPAYFVLAQAGAVGGAWWCRRRSEREGVRGRRDWSPGGEPARGSREVMADGGAEDRAGGLTPDPRALTPAEPGPSWGRTAGAVLLVAGLAVALYLPFHLTFQPPLVAEAGSLLPLGLVSRRSLLSQFLEFWGAQILLLIPVILAGLATVPVLRRSLGRSLSRTPVPRAHAPAIVAREVPGWEPALLVGGALVLIALAQRAGAGVLVLCLLMALGAGWAAFEALDPRASPEQPLPGGRPLAFAFGAICLGALLLAACEVVHIRDFYGGALRRMNTVFKLYYQAWLLFAAGGSVGAWWLLRALRPPRRMPLPVREAHAGTPRAEPLGRLGFGAFSLLCLVLFGATMLYPHKATLLRTDGFQNPATLDGMDWMRRFHPEDYAAAQWLGTHGASAGVRAPVIVEATGGAYSEYGRMATQTGFPTILGWDQHERLWRGARINAEVEARQRDLDAIYSAGTLDQIRSLLDKYKVAYVVVGYLEQQKYGATGGLAKFDAAAASGGLQVAFHQGQTAVYKVGT